MASLPELPSAAVIMSTAVATVAFLAVAKVTLWPARPRVLSSPLKARPDMRELVYRPDAMPGARDVDTAFGTIRVYEFGPEDGEKVLFVHGISTPCITLYPLARGLAERGCRVMLFDLFGRGFSDNPSDLQQDIRLFTAQILLVLASSRLSWTGTNALRLVGYSLGGGIAVHFANTFPHLVSELILLAPAGLIRPETFGRVSRFLFQSGFVPERLLAIATRRRLQQPIARDRPQKTPTIAEDYIDLATAEALDPATGEPVVPLEKQVLEYIRWSVVHHPGFVPAFMSSIRHAPLTDQHDSWKELVKREAGSTTILLAECDEIIDLDDYTRDALPLVGGDEHVRWKILPGGHDFVMTHTRNILAELDQMWEMKK